MRYLALIAILLPALANAQEITKPRLTVLDNGMRVITVEDHESRRQRLLKMARAATVGSVNRVLRQTLSTERVLKVEVGPLAN